MMPNGFDLMVLAQFRIEVEEMDKCIRRVTLKPRLTWRGYDSITNSRLVLYVTATRSPEQVTELAVAQFGPLLLQHLKEMKML